MVSVYSVLAAFNWMLFGQLITASTSASVLMPGILKQTTWPLFFYEIDFLFPALQWNSSSFSRWKMCANLCMLPLVIMCFHVCTGPALNSEWDDKCQLMEHLPQENDINNYIHQGSYFFLVWVNIRIISSSEKNSAF